MNDRTYRENLNKLIGVLQLEISELTTALHDAIRRPMGVIPDSALKFYDQKEADKAEERRVEIR